MCNLRFQVVVVDTLSSCDDVTAVKSCIQRGVAVVAAAEASSLRSLLSNTELSMLVGGTRPAASGHLTAR